MTSKEIILEQLNNGYLDLDTTGYKEELEYIKNIIKAFEILKEANVYVYELLHSKDLFDYNKIVWVGCEFIPDKLTQEEYDLLKKIL